MKRLLPFLIIALVALLTIGIGAALYRHKMKPSQPVVAKASASPAASASPFAATEKLVDRHQRGNPNAPLQLEIYGDFQCPSCATISAFIDELAKHYGAQLCLTFYEFPLAMHKHALEAAEAAEAAGLQEKFWEMHDALYQGQKEWSDVADVEQVFNSYAEKLGLDLERFRKDRKDTATRDRVRLQAVGGVARGVHNTPTLFVNGKQLLGRQTQDTIKTALEEALAATKKP